VAMEHLFGDSLIVRFLIAFAIIFILLLLFFWALRRFGGMRVGAGTTRGRQPRLAVIDAAAVDGRRRLVLIRRDNVEHLLMIGGPSDVVIEQNIMRAVPVASARDAASRMPAAAESASRVSDAPQRSAAAEPPAWTPPAESAPPRRGGP